MHLDMGMVTGVLTLASRVAELEERKVLLVQTQQKELAVEALVDAKVGDRVLVTKGSDCRLAEGFVDAAVVAVVESANLG